MDAAVRAAAVVVVVLTIIIVLQHRRAAKSAFSISQYVVDRYERQQKLNKYLASLPGVGSEKCTIAPYGIANAAINCQSITQIPSLPAQTPNGETYKPEIHFFNGVVYNIAPKSYKQTLAEQIPGTWSATIQGGPKIFGGCNSPLYENGYLSAYCATGSDAQPRYTMIEYPSWDVPLGTPLGNNHGQLVAEI